MYKRVQLGLALITTLLPTLTAQAETALQDPMRPPQYGAVGPERNTVKGNQHKTGSNNLRLTAIRISPAQRLATLNGRTVEVGSRIGNARVVAIDAKSITVLRNGKQVHVPLLPLNIKTPVEAVKP